MSDAMHDGRSIDNDCRQCGAVKGTPCVFVGRRVIHGTCSNIGGAWTATISEDLKYPMCRDCKRPLQAEDMQQEQVGEDGVYLHIVCNEVAADPPAPTGEYVSGMVVAFTAGITKERADCIAQIFRLLGEVADVGYVGELPYLDKLIAMRVNDRWRSQLQGVIERMLDA
jgi:hypothetical protein